MNKDQTPKKRKKRKVTVLTRGAMLTRQTPEILERIWKCQEK